MRRTHDGQVECGTAQEPAECAVGQARRSLQRRPVDHRRDAGVVRQPILRKRVRAAAAVWAGPRVLCGGCLLSVVILADRHATVERANYAVGAEQRVDNLTDRAAAEDEHASAAREAEAVASNRGQRRENGVVPRTHAAIVR
eukprot:7152550-Prymnesium_polylepis.1